MFDLLFSTLSAHREGSLTFPSDFFTSVNYSAIHFDKATVSNIFFVFICPQNLHSLKVQSYQKDLDSSNNKCVESRLQNLSNI